MLPIIIYINQVVVLHFDDAVSAYNSSLGTLKKEVSIFLSELSGFFITTGSAGTFNSVLKTINPEFDVLRLNAGVFKKFDSYQDTFERYFESIQSYPSDLSDLANQLKQEHDDIKAKYDSLYDYVVRVKEFRAKYPNSGIDITDLKSSKAFWLNQRMFNKKARLAYQFSHQLTAETKCNEFSSFLDMMVSLRAECEQLNAKILDAQQLEESKVDAQSACLEAKERLDSFDVGLESMKWLFRVFQDEKVISSLAVIDSKCASTVIDQFFKVRILYNFLCTANGHINMAEAQKDYLDNEKSLSDAFAALSRFDKICSATVRLGQLRELDYSRMAHKYISNMSFETGVSLVGFLTKRMPEFALSFRALPEQIKDDEDQGEELSTNGFERALSNSSSARSILEG